MKNKGFSVLAQAIEYSINPYHHCAALRQV
jgi:hypothetical protein